MIGRRLATVSIALPVLLAALWLGGLAWLALIAVVAALGVREMARLLDAMGMPVSAPAAAVAAIVALAPMAAVGVFGAPPTLAALGPFGALAVVMVTFLVAPGERPFSAFLGVLTAALYPCWLLGFLVLLRNGPHGAGTAFWVLAVVWVGDAAAYGAGNLIGGPHVVPSISPGKTLSGFVAGLVLSIATGAAAAPLAGLAWPEGLVLGALAAVAAQFGDLAESLLKRRARVKDSGGVLPGHGGVLDRVDGVLVAAPLLYYCLTVLRP